jgi:hypothetical protein
MTQLPAPSENPPTLPDAIAAPKGQSAWPTVIGIIAMVFGVLGILMHGVCGIVGQLFGAQAMRMMQTPDAEAQIVMMQQYKWLGMGAGLLQTILAVLLLFAGIAMTRRRANCRPLTLGWAYAKMLVVALSSVIGFYVQQAQFEAMTQQQANIPTGTQQMQTVFMFLVIAFGVLWGWALPIFMLIWLNRRTVRDEIAGWE